MGKWATSRSKLAPLVTQLLTGFGHGPSASVSFRRARQLPDCVGEAHRERTSGHPCDGIARHPARWSRDTRNWTPIGAVTLNPERDSVVAMASAAEDIQPLAA